MSTLTVSLVQMDIRQGSPRTNWNTMQEHTAEAARRGAELAVFPELWDAGPAYEKSKDIASSLSGGLFAQVVALARQQNIHILGSLYEKRGTGIYNTIAVISPRAGVMGAYRKIHLFPLVNEDKWLLPGEAPLAIDMPWGRTAFAICYDLRFPELFRRYAADRTAVVVVPMAWPHPRLSHYRTLLRARAIENQCYMIAVNRVGQDEEGSHYFGHSCVIDPWGETVVEAGETEGHFTVKLDLDAVSQVRRDLPALEGIRL
ncbi:MAG TPA: nitrilase-related carbon-nitrogen hydrolase [Aggregatilineaceae bacterium]|nr:nitrilase-related carbon-nitrogen hydrolase [Aggregatilineaceae bacterium]